MNVLRRLVATTKRARRAGWHDGETTVPFNLVVSSRFLYLYRLVAATESVPGAVVECGVGQGWSLLSLALALRDRHSPRALWGFDSFEGFPEVTAADASPRQARAGDYAVPMSVVMARLRASGLDELYLRGRVTLVKGSFADTLRHPEPAEISLLNLDVDLYDSYRTCLEALWPRVAVGGIVTFDEYVREAPNYPGAARAIDEFLDGRAFTREKDDGYGKYYVIKTAP